MTLNFFDKLIYRVRGRLPLVSAKLETMLVYTRGTGDPTPELALSRAPAGATRPEGEGGEGGGRGGGGQGGGGGEGGEGGASSEGDAGRASRPGQPPTAGQARQHGLRRSSNEAAPRPTLQITIGKLELHAAPPARKPEPAPRQGPALRLSDYLDRRR
ncbi:hypothetical protein WMF04_23945 [Sorangium sp. So ce260]|uniref:hypothetical protein n=1 Tax=Sorangium sp. So ce260 TaxID=3133291 RepID=UPI003F62D2FC